MIYLIMHWITGCFGEEERKLDNKGVMWVGTRCTVCGQFRHATPSCYQSNIGWASLKADGYPITAFKPCSEEEDI